MNAAPTAVLLDPEGTVGHLYNAKTTPEMFVINPEGNVIYAGAMNDSDNELGGHIAEPKTT